jgi:Na+/H+ antiporter NhaD/arsenite permease-like protein
MPWPTLLPFPALLLCIALLPLFAAHWWEHNRNKALVATVLAIPVAAYLVLGGAGAELGRSLEDYGAFLALLGSLFLISGGIHVRGSLSGTPIANTVMIGIGAALANVIGTTGASMVLIRPLLRANARRRRVAHIVVFFIFAVSNCGGLLTPLGDPPLFLGFLHGVPFGWTLRTLWAPWLLVNGVLLIVFQIVDGIVISDEERDFPEPLLEEVQEHAPLAIEGRRNFAFLAGVVLCMLGSAEGWGTGGEPWPFGYQEAGMAACALAAYAVTPARIRRANHFSFAPIVEVAALFFGIFVTIVPVMVLVNEAGPALGLDEPWQYFWATGSLSSFLDNAPTYLTFAASAAGSAGIPLSNDAYLGAYLANGGAEAARIMAGISAGAVFMGAMTYIGNGPNFMVKAIAESRGVRMPTFFGYMKWSMAVLLPLLVVVTAVFLR